MNKQRPRFQFGAAKPSPGQSPAAAPAIPDEQPRRAQAAARVPSREGKRVVSVYVEGEAWMQLRMLGLRSQRSTQDLMLDALDLLFTEHGQPRIARKPGESAER